MTMMMPRSLVVVPAVLTIALAAGCGKAPPAMPQPPALTIAAPPEAKIKSTMTITVSADANPDRNGRPSPVVLRIYQLKADSAFKAAELLPLYDDDQKVLGQELISRDEYVLQPSETTTLDVVLSTETRFVGAIVPFRDDRNAKWSSIVPAPKGGMTIQVGRASVALTPVTK